MTATVLCYNIIVYAMYHGYYGYYTVLMYVYMYDCPIPGIMDNQY